MAERNYGVIDKLIMQFDRHLNALFSRQQGALRPTPADDVEEVTLDESERRCSEGLMRVNHAGEVSAQALYQGQAITSRDPDVRATMQRSIAEEVDHLDWCERRLCELSGHTSYLNPVWYLGSLTIGTLAGLAGDKWSLGFVAETERQVVEHLQGHLKRLPVQDMKSRAIVQQMAIDEARHGTIAQAAGGVELPVFIKTVMRLSSKVMTSTAYWV